MEALIGQAMKDTVALRKATVPWTADEPCSQSYHAFDTKASAWTEKKTDGEAPADKSSTLIDKIELLSWNIDFMLPFAEARMKPALAHLETLIRATSSTTAVVIFIQECTPSDLLTIANTAWIQERFHVTDLDATTWATNHYGTVTLVDSRLPITAAFRVHYSKTRMDRDAFFIDVSLQGKSVRLCNTHLESLALDPPFRPLQTELIAKYLHDPQIHAGVVAGDFNAIQPPDRTLHSDNDLKDAYLELGGKEDTDDGYTWGQQAATKLREQFGCSRMDKFFYYGGIEVNGFERFGQDVVVEDGEEAEAIVKLGFEKAWVTDHLGIKAEIKLAEKSPSRL